MNINTRQLRIDAYLNGIAKRLQDLAPSAKAVKKDGNDHLRAKINPTVSIVEDGQATFAYRITIPVADVSDSIFRTYFMETEKYIRYDYTGYVSHDEERKLFVSLMERQLGWAKHDPVEYFTMSGVSA